MGTGHGSLLRVTVAEGHFGRGKAKSANTLETYTAAVAFMRKKHFNKGVLSDVMAGVKKSKTGNTRVKKTVTLPMMCDLTVRLSSPKAGNFGLMRAVVCNQLGQGLLRSMSAVAKAESQWDSGIHLTVADVDIMEDGWNFTFTSYAAPPQDRGLGTMGRWLLRI
jgi:hypothetical protein